MTLAEAQAALQAAQSTYSAARTAASTTSAEADRLRAEVVAGKAATVTPAAIAEATQKAEHAQLALIGAEAALAPLQAAVAAAEADQAADRIVAELPLLGTNLAHALDMVWADISDLISAARAYDDYAASAQAQINSAGSGASPRIRTASVHAVPTVDQIPLNNCRAWAHLAGVVAPAMAALGAPGFAVDQVKQLAASAPTIPTA